MSKNLKLKRINEIIDNPIRVSIPRYTISDLIMWLLFVHKDVPIYGRISFFKQVFLLYKEVLPDEIKDNMSDPKFVKYNYGPYSFHVADILEDLKYSGYICVEGKKNSLTERIYLSEIGKKESESRMDIIPDTVKSTFLKDLKERRIGWDQLRNTGLLKYVYKEYPEYTTKSKIKHKLSKTIWDEGRKG